MRVRAIAVAAERSNVVGTVELATQAQGLELTYLEAALLTHERAPVALASGTRLNVAWDEVRDARTVGNALVLELHVGHEQVHKLLLVRFSSGEDVTLAELRGRRRLVVFFAVGLVGLAMLVGAFAIPRFSPGTGALGSLLLTGLFGLVIAAVALGVDQRLVSGGARSEIVRELFIGELLATRPNLSRDPAPLFALSAFKLPALDGLLPRTTFALAATLTGALLATLILARWAVFGDHDEPARVPVSATPEPLLRSPTTPAEPPLEAASGMPGTAGSAAPLPSAVAAPLAGQLRVVGPCNCERPQSALWTEPLPKLSPLVLATRQRPHKKHHDTELDLALVNNSNKELNSVSMLVEFFDVDPDQPSQPKSVATRAVFFQGPLGPGKAVKWHVEAHGGSFRMHPPEVEGRPFEERLGPDGQDAAPADAVAELLAANHRPVRLHGAMMLAMQGDARARPGIVTLAESMRDEEAPFVRRLLEVTAEQQICKLEVAREATRGRVFACVRNRSEAPQSGLKLHLRALEQTPVAHDPFGPTPKLLVEREIAFSAPLPAKSSVAVTTDVELGPLEREPATWEAGVGPE